MNPDWRITYDSFFAPYLPPWSDLIALLERELAGVATVGPDVDVNNHGVVSGVLIIVGHGRIGRITREGTAVYTKHFGSEAWLRVIATLRRVAEVEASKASLTPLNVTATTATTGFFR